MNLKISEQLTQKIQYFLNRFPSKEWSGPAWYQIVHSDDTGFPEEIELIHFHPIHLGTTGATEYDLADVMPILNDLLKEDPRLENAFMGMIHSHHSMKAFFSTTDVTTLEEHAPAKEFYMSLVVSTSAVQSRAFAVSYIDQYGLPQTYEIPKESIIEETLAAPKDWITLADDIEDANKAQPQTTAVKTTTPQQQEVFKQYYTQLQKDQGKQLYDSYIEGRIEYHEMTGEMSKIGINSIYEFLRTETDFYDTDYDYKQTGWQGVH